MRARLWCRRCWIRPPRPLRHRERAVAASSPPLLWSEPLLMTPARSGSIAHDDEKGSRALGSTTHGCGQQQQILPAAGWPANGAQA